MSKLKANEIVADKWTNPDGSENYKVRAWVNFNGTGTLTINSAGNVSSITDIGVGQYTLNFTKAFVDTKYAIVFGVSDTLNGEATPKVLTTGGAANAPNLKTESSVSIGHVPAADTYDFSVMVVR